MQRCAQLMEQFRNKLDSWLRVTCLTCQTHKMKYPDESLDKFKFDVDITSTSLPAVAKN